jgi:hypothetical protein
LAEPRDISEDVVVFDFNEVTRRSDPLA